MSDRLKPFSLEWSLRYFEECERNHGPMLTPAHKAGIVLTKALRASAPPTAAPTEESHE